MKRNLTGLARQHPAALRKHLKQGPRATRQQSLRLGRQAVALNTLKTATELRRRAEARLRERHRDQKSDAGTQHLLHELEVHQIELETQNAELQNARDELETSLEKYTDLYDFAPVGYLSLNESGVILEANLTGAALLGLERTRLINRRLPLLVAPTSRPDFLAFLRRVFAETGKQVCGAMVIREDGLSFWAELNGTVAISPDGPTKWCRVAISDITVLKEAEEVQGRIAAIVQASDDAIIGEDLNGIITSWNPGAEKIFGFTAGEMVGASILRLVPADRCDEEKHILGNIKAGKSVQHFETQRRTKAGRLIDVSITASPIKNTAGKVIGVSKVIRDITERKRADDAQRRLEVLAASNRKLEQEIVRRQVVEKSLKQSEQHSRQLLEQSRQMQEQLRLLSRLLLSAQEEERKKISRELHDVIAQTLTSINLRLSALRKEAVLNTKGIERSIARTQELVEHSVNIVHRFARELRPTVLDDLGLIPALHTFRKSFKEETGIQVSLAAFAAVEQVNGDKRTVLYRVAQEALTNVARHAQASAAEVRIQKLDGTVCLRINDNGKGFPVERVLHTNNNKRLGLLGMRERVEMVNGNFTIESAPGKGTTIRVQIPFGSRRARAAENSRRIH